MSHLQNHNLPKSKPHYLFIGLGTMGFPMAGHLSANSNIDLSVFNRTSSISKKWVKKYKGAQFNLHEINNIKFDGVITCLKDDSSIIEVLKMNKVAHAIKKNGFILDHSTTSLNLISIISAYSYIRDNNISFFDAPVSGGESGALNGNLSVMLGGPNKKIAALNCLMSSYARSIVKVGPSGHGQLAKMVNQICIAGLLQGLSEGIALGNASDLNMSKVFRAISGGAAQSWQMDNRFKTMVQDKFNFGFAVDLMIKDLKIGLKEAKSTNLDLKISKSVLSNYKLLSEQGYGEMDTSSLIKLLKK
jgi:3-hydroxyisobutyrate dehydrogenase